MGQRAIYSDVTVLYLLSQVRACLSLWRKRRAPLGLVHWQVSRHSLMSSSTARANFSLTNRQDRLVSLVSNLPETELFSELSHFFLQVRGISCNRSILFLSNFQCNVVKWNIQYCMDVAVSTWTVKGQRIVFIKYTCSKLYYYTTVLHLMHCIKIYKVLAINESLKNMVLERTFVLKENVV